MSARATWSAGDWDVCARLIAPVGPVVLGRVGIEPGLELLDVGTGNGLSVAIPAARQGARVTGADVTPELFQTARRLAADAHVQVDWVEADAAALPFADASFDRVISTFGAMFAPDHGRAAAELVRVCRPGGRIAMTTWTDDSFIGELFALTGSMAPPQPPGAQPPVLWGDREHAAAQFAGMSPELERETVVFEFDSPEAAVQEYATHFGPMVVLRRLLEPQGRWDEFLERFGELIDRSGGSRIPSDYWLITMER